MVDQETLTMIKDIVTILGVIGGLTYYIISVRNQNRTRQAQLFMSLYDHYNDPEYWKNYRHIIYEQKYNTVEEYNEKYADEETNYIANASLMSYYSGVKLLLEKGLIDKDLVEKLMGYNIHSLWKKRESVILDRRERLKTSHWWNVEELYDQIKEWVEQEYYTAPQEKR